MDADKIVNFHVPDTYFIAPNAPQVQRRQAIAETWRGMLELPRLTFPFDAALIDVPRSVDLAMNLSHYDLSFETETR